MSANVVSHLELSQEIVKELEFKANTKISELGKSLRIIKEEIFGIIAKNSIFLQYPIEDDELCGFVCPKGGKLFSFVNSYIQFDKQIFAAAHELYHIWYDEDVLKHGDFISLSTLNLNGDNKLSLKENMANRFAAMLLVPKRVLRNELDELDLRPNNLKLFDVIRLMDVFGVPYKAIVRRLYEIDFISLDKCLELMNLSDKEEDSPVRIAQKRLQLGVEQQRRTNIIRFDGLLDAALHAFEEKKITEDKLKYLLSLARKGPEEFGISRKAMNEKDILEFLEND